MPLASYLEMESYSAGAKIIGLALALEGGGGTESSMQGAIHLHRWGGVECQQIAETAPSLLIPKGGL